MLKGEDCSFAVLDLYFKRQFQAFLWGDACFFLGIFFIIVDVFLDSGWCFYEQIL